MCSEAWMKIHTRPGIQALGYLALLGLFGYGLSFLVVITPHGEISAGADPIWVALQHSSHYWLSACMTWRLIFPRFENSMMASSRWSLDGLQAVVGANTIRL
jgi:hypothetical protein